MTTDNPRVFPRINKLRVLTNKSCNLDCLYCHKEGQFSPREPISHEERKELLEVAYEFGVDEVKFSGGEPLLYEGLADLVRQAKDYGIPRASVTTNGILLERKVEELKSSRLDELSISIDTLDAKKFVGLNGGIREEHQRILEGIQIAKKIGFPIMNLNMAVTGYNEGEVDSMMKYAREVGVPLRLISFIPLGGPHEDKLSVKDPYLFDKLKKRAVKVRIDSKSPAYTGLTMPSGQQVELVDPLCFDCDSCGKSYALRLTTDGKLKSCLISERGEINVIEPLRKGDREELERRFMQAIAIKKLGLVKMLGISPESLSKKYLTE
jgi:GTP 3',8-cyclase